MGNGLAILNDTQTPLNIRLKQVGVLYHGIVQPGEVWFRKTGAVWFTVEAYVAAEDDTSVFWEAAFPVLAVVGGVVAAMVTAGTTLAADVAAGGLAAFGTQAGAITMAGTVCAAGAEAATLALVTTTAVTKAVEHAQQGDTRIAVGGVYGSNQYKITGGVNVKEIHTRIQSGKTCKAAYSGAKLKLVQCNVNSSGADRRSIPDILKSRRQTLNYDETARQYGSEYRNHYWYKEKICFD